MAEIVYQTPSGIAIPQSDAVAIQRQARNESIRNVFALVGVGTVAFLAFGFLKSLGNENPSDD